MHIKHIITKAFKKHDIQDEKLALALNEILKLIIMKLTLN